LRKALPGNHSEHAQMAVSQRFRKSESLLDTSLRTAA